jgi:GTP-binding protein Era
VTTARCGFAAVIGRPNVGKSTLVNAMVGEKVSITSKNPNTTRLGVRGVLHRPGAEVVFVDTPGLHRPRSALGTRLNATARSATAEADVVVAVVDATADIGPGDRRALEAAASTARPLVAVNKLDRATEGDLLPRLHVLGEFLSGLSGPSGEGEDPFAAEVFPVSAKTGEGVDPLVEAIVERLPVGPPPYPEEVVRDLPEAAWVAELVREQLLARVREELPHAIACRVTEWEGPYLRCEILVERESQKAIVIGRHGEVLKEVGTAVRRQLPEHTYLELVVKVERHWQRREDALDRLGY